MEKHLKKQVMSHYSGKFLVLLAFLVFSVGGFSQTGKQKKEMRKLMKKAEALFVYGDYINAIGYYEKVLKIDSLDNEANYKMGVSHFKVKRLRSKALRYLEKVQSARFPETKYYLGQIYHHLHNFEKAIEVFKKYQSLEGEKEFGKSEVNHLIDECYNAMYFESHTVGYMDIENLGPEVNSVFPDYVPLIPADESFLLFTSRRDNSTGKLKDPYGDYFEDIYISYSKNKKWSAPKNLDTTVNSSGHDACTGLSADGEKLLVYRTDKALTGGDIYQSNYNGTSWTRPEILTSAINMPGSVESSACFSPDGETIFFSSNREGGFGGQDIYMIRKLPGGKWGQPMNLGKDVNTEYDEDAPFVHPNGTILFFSSKGHNNMGGYDVFKTSFNDLGQFGKCENMGFPLNTVDDDIFFVMNTQATTGYISSERDGGLGSLDLYAIHFSEKNLDLAAITAFLTDEEGHPMPNSEVTILDPMHHRVEGIYKPNALTGKFVMILEPGKPYTIILKADGFDAVTSEFSGDTKTENHYKLKKQKQQ
jgi:tetratricopeptide (TPR) repeat protein